MLARVALLLTVAALAAPGVAAAQENPFTPLPPSAPTTTDQPSQPISPRVKETNDGFGGTTTWLFVGASIALLFGLGWLIVRDARRRAPVQDRLATDSGPRGTVSPNRHARARARAKAGRQARKRNRAKR